MSVIQKLRLFKVFVPLCMLIWCQGLMAEHSGFFIGTGLGLEDFKTKYEKRGDDRLFPSLSLRDLIYSDRNTQKGTPYSLGAFAGYRMDLRKDRGLWAAVQAEFVLRGDIIEGTLKAKATKIDGTIIPNFTSEDWSFKTDRSVTYIGKVGTGINLFGVVNFSIYGLGGIRELDVAFTRTYKICLVDTTCENEQETSTATETRRPTLRQLTGGVGIEKSLGDKTALQFEARLMHLGEDEWEQSDSKLEIPASLSNESYNLSAKLVHYF